MYGNKMKKVGFVGWRGMVGSVLMDRMKEENDFKLIHPVFFTTSQIGEPGPDIGSEVQPLIDANSVEYLGDMDLVVSCQGSDYTKQMHSLLRNSGWNGYWIDAASFLRKSEKSIIVLDPINSDQIEKGIDTGIKDYVGGNCTVSLMLMAIGGLFKENLIQWVCSMTYQAASGAGAASMQELLTQMTQIGEISNKSQTKSSSNILEIDKDINKFINSDKISKENFGYSLAGNVLPYIDSQLKNGQSREEWKNQFETNKILGTTNDPIPLDGICVRVGSMRCHSQALTIKLKKPIPIGDLETIIEKSNKWVRVVQNSKEASLNELTPSAVSGKLNIPVGRLRIMNMGDDFVSAFTSGDQLLWGAAEPLRRVLKILIKNSS